MDYLLHPDLLKSVFDKRNQNYGAYELRMNYEVRLRKAFLFTLLFLTSIILVGIAIPKSEPPVPIKKITTYIFGKDIDDTTMYFLKHMNDQETPLSDPTNRLVAIVPDHEIKMQKDTSSNSIQHDIGSDHKNNSGGGNDTVQNIVDVFTKKPPTIIEPPQSHAQVMPQFPEGEEAFKRYLDEHISPSDFDPGSEFVIQFVVEIDGSISHVRVLKGYGSEKEEILMQVIKGMPAWSPGSNNGQPTRVYLNLPISFVDQE